MTEKRVRFSNSEDVENFVNAAGQCDFEIDILYDHIYIDAKSFLGVLGLNFWAASFDKMIDKENRSNYNAFKRME